MTTEQIKERFQHPSVQASIDVIDAKVAVYITELEAIRDEDDQALSAESIESASKCMRATLMVQRTKNLNDAMYGWVKVPKAFLDTVTPASAHWSLIGVFHDEEEEYEVSTFNGETGEETVEVKTRTISVPTLDTDGEPVMRQKTVGEYILRWVESNDGSEVIFGLCAMEYPVFRQSRVTEDDIGDWLTLLPAYGISLDNVMNWAERNVLLATDEWLKEEV